MDNTDTHEALGSVTGETIDDTYENGALADEMRNECNMKEALLCEERETRKRWRWGTLSKDDSVIQERRHGPKVRDYA